VRRETISAYLKASGVEIWPPGRWRQRSRAKPAIQVITGFGVELRGSSWENQRGVPSASACEPFREIIELGLTGPVIHRKPPVKCSISQAALSFGANCVRYPPYGLSTLNFVA
jgi:hypothetical protein